MSRVRQQATPGGSAPADPGTFRRLAIRNPAGDGDRIVRNRAPATLVDAASARLRTRVQFPPSPLRRLDASVPKGTGASLSSWTRCRQPRTWPPSRRRRAAGAPVRYAQGSTSAAAPRLSRKRDEQAAQLVALVCAQAGED